MKLTPDIIESLLRQVYGTLVLPLLDIADSYQADTRGGLADAFRGAVKYRYNLARTDMRHALARGHDMRFCAPRNTDGTERATERANAEPLTREAYADYCDRFHEHLQPTLQQLWYALHTGQGRRHAHATSDELRTETNALAAFVILDTARLIQKDFVHTIETRYKAEHGRMVKITTIPDHVQAWRSWEKFLEVYIPASGHVHLGDDEGVENAIVILANTLADTGWRTQIAQAVAEEYKPKDR